MRVQEQQLTASRFPKAPPHNRKSDVTHSSPKCEDIPAWQLSRQLVLSRQSVFWLELRRSDRHRQTYEAGGVQSIAPSRLAQRSNIVIYDMEAGSRRRRQTEPASSLLTVPPTCPKVAVNGRHKRSAIGDVEVALRCGWWQLRRPFMAQCLHPGRHRPCRARPADPGTGAGRRPRLTGPEHPLVHTGSAWQREPRDPGGREWSRRVAELAGQRASPRRPAPLEELIGGFESPLLRREVRCRGPAALADEAGGHRGPASPSGRAGGRRCQASTTSFSPAVPPTCPTHRSTAVMHGQSRSVRLPSEL